MTILRTLLRARTVPCHKGSDAMKTTALFTAAAMACALLLVSPAVAQPAPAPAEGAAPLGPAPAESADPGAITLFLMDGSMIGGTLGLKEITIETEFGALRVPVGRIVSFT